MKIGAHVSIKGRGFKRVRDQITSSIAQILSQTPQEAALIIENASGGGGKVGSDFSGLDRHENIGEGHLGLEGFRNILNHLALSHLPFVIETPRSWRGSPSAAGFDKLGPDQRNIFILRSLTIPGTLDTQGALPVMI